MRLGVDPTATGRAPDRGIRTFVITVAVAGYGNLEYSVIQKD
jgi:hypothetical protein